MAKVHGQAAAWGWAIAVLAAAAVAALLLSGQGPEPTPRSPPPDAPAASPAPPEIKGPRALDVAPIDVATDDDATRRRRAEHVQDYIERRGVVDEAVLEAMRTTPRQIFVPARLRPYAYEDRPLPIGEEQTISQPYIVASMTEEAGIAHGDKVLEIGTGSGYQAAVLASITPHVFSIEIKEKLAQRAAATLKGAGYTSVKVANADGYQGWPEEAPFDAILVTAAAPHVPPPLVEQLKKGGRMVIPVGSPFAVQDLVLVTKDEEGEVRTRSLYRVRFVPLTGSLGESSD